jgi:hypothetical protein
MLDLCPEFQETIEPLFDGIARDQAGIDRPDRGADHAVGFDSGFMQRLVDADLISTQSIAALQHKNDLTKRAAKFPGQ